MENVSTVRVRPLAWQHTAVPLSLVLLCPPFAMAMWFAVTQSDGSLSTLFSQIVSGVFVDTIRPIFFGSPTAWLIIGLFASFELLLMRLMPGEKYFGPTTPKGNVPEYRANGVAAFIVTMFVFMFMSVVMRVFSPTVIYDHFGEIIGALNCLSLLVCAGLYFKGRMAPSSTDNGVTGNCLFDFYWGTELYPRVLGFDVKQFTNCRFGMMSWGLIVISFAAKQSELYGLSNGMIIAVVLQLVYVAKFFWWETGYLSSLDIMHDRAGFYICWGCMVWVPSIYTSATLFMVNHPLEMPGPVAMLLLLAGVACIFINYFADRQRQLVRETGGACLVWGRKPELLVAHYVGQNGEPKQNLLLLSGFWGVSRHFHYVPELLAALCWSLPAGISFGLPYFYVVFLAILLTHRALRDDARCAQKYGSAWQAYCERVPAKIIPGIF